MIENGNERILIIAPHADDDVLGCGGIIEKACRFGNQVKVVIGAVGDTKHPHQNQSISRDVRKKEVTESLLFLGCTTFEILYDDKDALLDTIPKKEIISRLDHLLNDFLPTIIFIPLPSYHQDHQTVYDCCIAALRPNPLKHYKLIAMYEYPLISWYHQSFWNIGAMYLDISNTIEKKIEAFKMHQSQIRLESHPLHPENVKKWAEIRGLEGGVKYAEKYYVLKSMLF